MSLDIPDNNFDATTESSYDFGAEDKRETVPPSSSSSLSSSSLHLPPLISQAASDAIPPASEQLEPADTLSSSRVLPSATAQLETAESQSRTRRSGRMTGETEKEVKVTATPSKGSSNAAGKSTTATNKPTEAKSGRKKKNRSEARAGEIRKKRDEVKCRICNPHHQLRKKFEYTDYKFDSDEIAYYESIECARCEAMFHYGCIGKQPYELIFVDSYCCQACEASGGATIMMTPAQRKEYPTKVAGQIWLKTYLKERKFNPHRTVKNQTEFGIIKMANGRDFTNFFNHKELWRSIFLIEDNDGLAMKLPPQFGSQFGIDELFKLVTGTMIVKNINQSGGSTTSSMSQVTTQMTLSRFKELFKKSGARDRTYNIASLEFSTTQLAEVVVPPAVYKQLSLADKYWPLGEELDENRTDGERPAAERFVLVGMGGAFMDFHIDFGGSSVWYHVHFGEKEFFVAPPTEKNLQLFEEHMGKDAEYRADHFLGEFLEDCWRIKLRAGNTLLIPSGWIHAVHTPTDSIVFGGNFLTFDAMETQIKVHRMDKRRGIDAKYCYPNFEGVLFHAAYDLRNQLDEYLAKKNKGEIVPDVPEYFESAKAVHKYLKTLPDVKKGTKKFAYGLNKQQITRKLELVIMQITNNGNSTKKMGKKNKKCKKIEDVIKKAEYENDERTEEDRQKRMGDESDSESEEKIVEDNDGEENEEEEEEEENEGQIEATKSEQVTPFKPVDDTTAAMNPSVETADATMEIDEAVIESNEQESATETRKRAASGDDSIHLPSKKIKLAEGEEEDEKQDAEGVGEPLATIPPSGEDEVEKTKIDSNSVKPATGNPSEVEADDATESARENAPMVIQPGGTSYNLLALLAQATQMATNEATRIEGAERERDELKKQLEDERASRVELQKEKDDLLVERDEQKARAEKAEREKNERESENEELKAEASRVQKEKDDRISALLAQLDDLKKANDALVQKCEISDDSRAQTEKEKGEMEKERDTQIARAEQAEKYKDDLAKQLRDEEAVTEQLRAEKKELKDQSEARAAQDKKEKEDMSARISTLETNAEQVRKEKDGLAAANVALKSNLNVLEKEKEDLKKEGAEKDAQAEQDKKERDARIAELTASNTQLQFFVNGVNNLQKALLANPNGAAELGGGGN